VEMENNIIKRLRELLGERLIEVNVQKERRIFVKVDREAFKEAVKNLVNKLGFKHLSTITGIDLGEDLEIIYHLSYKGSIELSLKVNLPKEEAKLPTVTDLIPGALLYEREVHDLLGVFFTGHPDLSPLLLPEKWPHDVYPLRKEESLESLQKAISRGR